MLLEACELPLKVRGSIHFGVIRLCFLVVGVFVGWLSWGSGVEISRLTLILVLPIAWGLAKSRWSATLLMAGYYLAGSRGLPGGTAVFFGDAEPVWFGWLIWVFVCALLTLPFFLLWSNRRTRPLWTFSAASCASLVPPLAIVGWLNPLAVSGVAFPEWGWIGLILTFALVGALTVRYLWLIVFLSALSVFANGLTLYSDLSTPVRWHGKDTSFPRMSSAGSDDAGMLLFAAQRLDWVKEFAKTIPPATVMVLPETVLGTLDGAGLLSLRDTEAALTARGSRILVGAELVMPAPDFQYKNTVVVLGAKMTESRFAVQNIPVPIAMWKPWASDGAVAHVLGQANVILVGNVHSGVLICYEQLLAYSLLRTLFDKPDVLVAVSNHWWARNTPIPAIQEQTVKAFSRLFGVGVVMARNN